MNCQQRKGFRDLLVWRQGMEVRKACYALTKRLPPEERYGLTMQIRRAAASIPANIAEGNGRRTRRDYVNFLHIAQGSLRELETYLLLLSELNLLPLRSDGSHAATAGIPGPPPQPPHPIPLSP
ncbi:MAG: four helix bundle protein [Candidatus Binatia bacterium]